MHTNRDKSEQIVEEVASILYLDRIIIMILLGQGKTDRVIEGQQF